MTAFKMDSSEGGRGGRKEAKESEGKRISLRPTEIGRRYATHSPHLLSRILWAEVSVSVQVELDCEVSVG